MKAGDSNADLSAKNYLPSSQKKIEDLSDEELRALRDKMIEDQDNKEQQP